MPHHRARMTPRGREMVVRRVVDDGILRAGWGAWGNVSKSTVWEWVRRWRAATPAERESLACLEERSSRLTVLLSVSCPGRSSGSVSCAGGRAGARGRSRC
jgi:leucine-zipper of insertion element IS481